MKSMQDFAEAVVRRYFGVTPRILTPLGGGFYGRVFLAELASQPAKVVVKMYIYPHLAGREAAQLKLLSRHAAVKMPEVYAVHGADPALPRDAVVMEYIPGVGAAGDLALPEAVRASVAEAMVDNLLCFHRAVNPEGFGEIGAVSFEPDWRVWYRPRADAALAKAEEMVRAGRLGGEIFSVMRAAHERYDKLFFLPIEKARLIHGDYNPWNMLLDENLTRLVAVIDPFGCCWADSELDLYQLNHANGRYYGLLDRYAAKFPPSENFQMKTCFYELFTETAHHYNAGVPVDGHKAEAMTAVAGELERQMKAFGVL